MERVRPQLIAVASVGVTLALVVVSAAVLGATYESWLFLVPVTFAAALSGSLAVVLHRAHAPAGVSLLASVVAFVVVGTAVVDRGVPVLGTLDFLGTLTRSWHLMLDVTPPLRARGADLAVPFTTSWAAAAIGAELTLRTRSVALPLVGPLAMLVVAVLFGVESETLTDRVGVLLFTLVIVHLLVRSRQSSPVGRRRSTTGGRVLVLSGVLIVAAAAPVLAGALPEPPAHDRVTLRESYEPAFDPQRLASPLSRMKESLRAPMRDDVLFTIAGPPTDRIRLAILREYDGVVFTMASRDRGAFRPIGAALPLVDGEPESGATDRYTISIDQLAGPWLPVPGSAVDIDTRSTMLQDELRFDPADANVLTRQPLEPGLSYTAEVRDVPDYTVGLGAPALVEPRTDLGALQPFATSIVGDAPDPSTRLERIRAWFVRNGYYDAEALPGHNAGRLESFLRSDDGVIGYDEQYAAAFAVLAQQVGLDVRVVVGFEPAAWDDTTAVVRRADLRAWTEVRVLGVGWATIDITPVRPKEADDTTVSADKSAGRLPEAPPIDQSVVTTTTVANDDSDDDGEQFDAPTGGWTPAEVAGATIATVLIVAGSLVALVLTAKRRRRRRRRRTEARRQRLSGAWLELVDQGIDRGHRPTPGATLRETGAALADHLSVDRDEVTTLATVTDRAGFAADEPNDDEVDEAWHELLRLERLVAARATRWARFRAAVSPASLRRSRRRRMGSPPHSWRRRLWR